MSWKESFGCRCSRSRGLQVVEDVVVPVRSRSSCRSRGRAATSSSSESVADLAGSNTVANGHARRRPLQGGHGRVEVDVRSSGR